MDKIKTGSIVFVTDDCRDGRADARAWLKSKCLTPDQARLYAHDGQVLVEALQPIDIKSAGPKGPA